jgi:hypothetical protein
MAFIRRTWMGEAADHWTREDWLAAVLSVVSYLLLIMGTVLSLLAQPLGYALLLVWLAITALMYYIIDPKLRAVSADYEAKQKDYLKHLEGVTRWKEQ